MADKEHKEQKIGSQLPGESIKVIAESVGISGIPDDAASVLAEDSSYRLKQIVQVSSLPNNIPLFTLIWCMSKCNPNEQ